MKKTLPNNDVLISKVYKYKHGYIDIISYNFLNYYVTNNLYISKNIDVGKYYQKLSKSSTATLYEIKVTIDTDKLLRWDLTLNQQPAFVKKVLETVYYDFDSDPNPKASKVFYALRSSASSGKVGPEDSVRASEYLEEQGIQGVFFSKDKKLPGQNFVIFNPKRISILKRFDNKGKEII